MTLTPQQTSLAKKGGIVVLGGLAIYGMFKLWMSTKTYVLYQDIYDGKPNNQLNLSTWGGLFSCPGSKVMNGQNYTGNAHQRALAVSNRLHDVASGFWTWDGKIAGEQIQNGICVLDQTEDRGECAYIANALMILLTAQAPYGLGLGAGIPKGAFPAGPIQRVNYTGQYNKGFISTNQNAPFHLVSNVYAMNGQRQAYYLWDDHKVVEYDHGLPAVNGGNPVYYDPNFATTQGGPGYYNALDEMAHYQLQTEIYRFGQGFDFGNKWVENIYTVRNRLGAAAGVFIVCVQYGKTLAIADPAVMQQNGFDPSKLSKIAIGPLTLADGYDPANFDFQRAKTLVDTIHLTP